MKTVYSYLFGFSLEIVHLENEIKLIKSVNTVELILNSYDLAVGV